MPHELSRKADCPDFHLDHIFFNSVNCGCTNFIVFFIIIVCVFVCFNGGLRQQC